MSSLDLARSDIVGRSIDLVVVGGSAGSIPLLRKLLPALPRPPRPPIVAVVHIASATKTVWPSVFAGTLLEVLEAEAHDVVRPGTFTLAPPDYHLLIDEQGRLSLAQTPEVNYARPSIDVLFESAAWGYGSRVLGVVLSGANSDGAIGLRAIHDAGGLAWVQHPDDAAAPFMPRAAIEAVPAARALNSQELVDAFVALATGGHDD